MADRHQKSGKKADPTARTAQKRVVYAEFGDGATAKATERAVPDLPPNQQDLRVQASRKGRGGKTVTVISGLQHSPDALKTLLKTLKAQCGTGGTVRDDTLELQGDVADRLVEALVKLGYRAKRSGG
ncbi:MAG: hypothetical protein Fur0042_28910 [Cyanophyceae cyanobacterium]